MKKFITKFTLFLFVLGAFFGPLAAVMAFEKSKRAEKIAARQEEITVAQRDMELARYQYYIDINGQKNNLRQAMQDAKAQYEQLLKDQPGLVASKQTARQQTVIKPVVTQKIAEQKVAVSSNSKPKSSTKTRTS
ncbi:MAG: hypothetical protein WA082_00685 [Candidatus Moraniibacteriota bacterium]